jgi:hypothetical protein
LLAEILALEQANEGRRGILEALDHVLAILDPAVPIHCETSRRKSSRSASKSQTMKPRMVSRLVRVVRSTSGARFGPGGKSVALYWAIRPQTGTRAKKLSSGSTASNTGPPTFSQ